jgi:uncharacterized membrane protein YfcA
VIFPSFDALAVCALAIALSGMVRGFSGFGFALIAVPGMALVIDPRASVSVAMALQTFAGVVMLRRGWREADWPLVGVLSAGSLATLWLGLLLLDRIDPASLRVLIGATVLVAAAAIGMGVKLARPPGPWIGLGVGAASGLLNGMTGMGGPPAIVALLGSPFPPERTRATLGAFFTVLGGTTVAGASMFGRFGGGEAGLALILLPPLITATILGEELFRRGGGRRYRPLCLGVVCLIALAAIVDGVSH